MMQETFMSEAKLRMMRKVEKKSPWPTVPSSFPSLDTIHVYTLVQPKQFKEIIREENKNKKEGKLYAPKTLLLTPPSTFFIHFHLTLDPPPSTILFELVAPVTAPHVILLYPKILEPAPVAGSWRNVSFL